MVLKSIGLGSGTRDSRLASCCSFFFFWIVFRELICSSGTIDLMTIKGQIRAVCNGTLNKCTL